jgi:hypothetical protein
VQAIDAATLAAMIGGAVLALHCRVWRVGLAV